LRWSDVWILYRREMRSALRERTVVTNGILLPLLLYPVLLWMVVSGLTLVAGLSERTPSRVAFFSVPEAHQGLREALVAVEGMELRAAPPTIAEARAAVTAGELDAAVEFLPPPPGAAALASNFEVRIAYDRAEDRSRRAAGRVREVVDDYRRTWLQREAAALGIPPQRLTQFRVETVNVSTGGEMGARALGQIAPTLLVIMVALGCFFPAIDTTAGERERGTWETLMTVASPRSTILLAKYLYVATLGLAAGALNVTAMTLSLGVIFSGMAGGGEALLIRMPLGAIPYLFAGAAALALFFAAGMMILSSFARTFRDGQSMVAPIYYLAILPVLMGDSSDRRLTPELALVPIVNVTQMMKDALRGDASLLLAAESMAVLLLVVAGCLWLARVILEHEDHVIGAYDGSFWRFARQRLMPGGRRRTPGGERAMLDGNPRQWRDG